ncbi:hypothetical protein ABIE24_002734 [Mycetocola sp. 2940]
MVADGADTIYDPEHWVVALYLDPRGYIGAVSNAGRVLIKTGGRLETSRPEMLSARSPAESETASRVSSSARAR